METAVENEIYLSSDSFVDNFSEPAVEKAVGFGFEEEEQELFEESKALGIISPFVLS
jgi:hypothetical protein